MKTGDLMVELRKLPGGRPFAVKVGSEVHREGHLVVTKDGVFLVMGGKKAPEAAPKRRGRPKK